jgi:hypothetical protein
MKTSDQLANAIFDDDLSAAREILAAGADPNGELPGCPHRTLVWLATFHGRPEILEALIAAGASVPESALDPLGQMDITDHMIDPIHLERRYAAVAATLIEHGASPNVTAYDGRPLIATFPEGSCPTLHRVLADAISTANSRNAS